jgi:TatD DNase family protein
MRKMTSPTTTIPRHHDNDDTDNNDDNDTTIPTNQCHRLNRYVDIGANLLDERYTQGVYHEKKRHDADLNQVIERARNIGVRHIVLTAGTVEESALAVQTVRALRQQQQQSQQQSDEHDQVHFSCTVGVHPTRCLQEFVNCKDRTDEESLQRLLDIVQDGMSDGCVAAIGEIGLDYDRLSFTPKDVQQTYLVRQLETFKDCPLPLFLHNRNVGNDLYDLLVQHKDCWSSHGGVVHSFDDSFDLATKFVSDLGLYIGLNGCSLRTKDNLETVQQLPLSSILLETDCPYCEIKRTHASYTFVQTHFQTKPEKKFEAGVMVKGRCEPCMIVQVAEVVAGVKGIPLQDVADACYENSLRLYGWKV